ncbi:MAG: hypothetical protein ACKPKO_47355 [Candidatus Fonsibacter sp.]
MIWVAHCIYTYGRKVNPVLYGITTINGLALLTGPVTLSSRITGIDISDVAGLQTALDLKAPYGRHNEGYDWTWQRR